MYINPNKVVTADIVEPYENSGESWDMTSSHGWRVSLIYGFNVDGYPHVDIIERESKKACVELIQKLNLVSVD